MVANNSDKRVLNGGEYDIGWGLQDDWDYDVSDDHYVGNIHMRGLWLFVCVLKISDKIVKWQ